MGGYSYTPAYYSTLHDSITSICKNILPFSLKKRRLVAAERKQSKEQADNLKWQQESFHQMLNLMGLQKEGMVSDTEVAAYRSKLLETLIVSRPHHEQPVILRDKLLFLQDLLYAKCISTEEYHASKRPLLQRLAMQGAEIEARDVILGAPNENKNNNLEEEWSVIDLKDEQCLLTKENSNSKNRSKIGSAAIKHMKGTASSVLFGFGPPQKHGRNRKDKSIFEITDANNPPPPSSIDEKGNAADENSFWDNSSKNHPKGRHGESKSILMAESLTPDSDKFGGAGTGNVKKKAISDLLFREREDNSHGKKQKDGESRSGKKQWGFDGIKNWKRGGSTSGNVDNMEVDHETTPLPLGGRTSNGEQAAAASIESSCYSSSSSYRIVVRPIGEAPDDDARQIRRKLVADGSASDFSVDEVAQGEKIKKELTRIQTELSRTNPNRNLSNNQIEAISTKPPADEKADLEKIFPVSRCDRYGDRVGETENTRNTAGDKHTDYSTRWATFEDDENCHPNLFPAKDYGGNKCRYSHSYNPFLLDQSEDPGHHNKLRTEPAFYHDQNPFWSSSHS